MAQRKRQTNGLEPAREKSASTSRRDDAGGPLVGALLRLAYTELSQEIQQCMTNAGYGDLQERHRAVTQPLFDRPDGARATELAELARVTKQSMAATVEQLVELGYVECIADPDDKRAQRVRFTKRGWDAAHFVRSLVRRVEHEWGRRIGQERFAALRSALADLVSSAAKT
jgi:DNA-binding MarR family transcriptional regulator